LKKIGTEILKKISEKNSKKRRAQKTKKYSLSHPDFIGTSVPNTHFMACTSHFSMVPMASEDRYQRRVFPCFDG
jgi:hypothetical protein